MYDLVLLTLVLGLLHTKALRRHLKQENIEGSLWNRTIVCRGPRSSLAWWGHLKQKS